MKVIAIDENAKFILKWDGSVNLDEYKIKIKNFHFDCEGKSYESAKHRDIDSLKAVIDFLTKIHDVEKEKITGESK